MAQMIALENVWPLLVNDCVFGLYMELEWEYKHKEENIGLWFNKQLNNNYVSYLTCRKDALT